MSLERDAIANLVRDESFGFDRTILDCGGNDGTTVTDSIEKKPSFARLRTSLTIFRQSTAAIIDSLSNMHYKLDELTNRCGPLTAFLKKTSAEETPNVYLSMFDISYLQDVPELSKMQ